MIKKLIVIGIDGMDLDVVMRYQDKLPNIMKMIGKNPNTTLRSVFPADTTPAWSTIYTGLDPTEHGIINFVNVGAKNNTYKPFSFDDSVFYGKAFWEVLNQNGLSCTVLLPMNIKKGWDINGLMITRPYEGKMYVYPKAKEALYQPKFSILGTESKFTAESSLPILRDEFFAKQAEEWRLTKLALENEDTDVLFSYFSTTDGIQHDFWRHCDPTHPNYPGKNDYDNVVRDMYIRMDECLGEIIKMQPDTPLLVMSDHGHGARPVYIARINEMLRRGGYLEPSTSNKSSSGKKSLKKKLKKFAINTVKKVGLPKWAMKLARKFPIWKNLFASGADFNWDKTVAFLSDLSALKNYSYGGIRLSESVEDKDKLADEIIAYLQTIMIEEENKPLFEWIARTNTFYHGEFLNKYPEIIFQMDERYGGEWELGENLIDKNVGFMYAMSPGGHRWNTAVLFGNHIELEAKRYEMTDIYKLIMQFSKA